MQLDVNGIAPHYDIHGDGEPLLWLHGGLGCGADWKHVFTESPFHLPRDGARRPRAAPPPGHLARQGKSA